MSFHAKLAAENSAADFHYKPDEFKLIYIIQDPELPGLIDITASKSTVSYSQYIRLDEKSAFGVILLSICVISFNVVLSVSYSRYSRSPLMIAFIVFCIVTNVFGGVAVSLIRIFPKVVTPTVADILENGWSTAVDISLCAVLVYVTINGTCTNGDTYRYLECSGVASLGKIDESLGFQLLLHPLLFNVVVKTLNWRLVIVSFIGNVIVIFYCVIGYGLDNSMFRLIGYGLIVLVVMWEYRVQTVNLYIFASNQEMLARQIRLDAARNGEALRHMISNVAHDLKTVGPVHLYALAHTQQLACLITDYCRLPHYILAVGGSF